MHERNQHALQGLIVKDPQQVTRPLGTAFPQNAPRAELGRHEGPILNTEVRSHVPRSRSRTGPLGLRILLLFRLEGLPLLVTQQSCLSLHHEHLSTRRVTIQLVHKFSHWHVGYGQVLGQVVFPRSSTRRISQDVRLATNPHSHQVKPLQLQRPIRHLLAPPTIVKLSFREQVVLVVNVTKHLETLDETLMLHDTLPQRIELTLHR